MEHQTVTHDGFCQSDWIYSRFKISRLTLRRWMARPDRPFPAAAMRPGRNRFWRISDVLAWEAAETGKTAA